VLKENIPAESLRTGLQEQDVELKAVTPDIEDCFMALMKN
jgi:hypothetical protein